MSMQMSALNRSFFVLFLWGAFIVMPSVLNDTHLLRNIDLVTNCCQQSTGIGSPDELIPEDLKGPISKEQALRIAESLNRGKMVDISLVASGEQPFYRIKSITPNSGQTYTTGIDAITGEVLFNDEVWWLVEWFRS